MDTREEKPNAEDRFLPVERVQIGVLMEKRMVKVLKGLAEYHDMSPGDLLEGIVLHAFENTSPFSEDSLLRIAQLKEVYGMDYSVSTPHQYTESDIGSEIT
jgi:hypothetical protein